MTLIIGALVGLIAIIVAVVARNTSSQTLKRIHFPALPEWLTRNLFSYAIALIVLCVALWYGIDSLGKLAKFVSFPAMSVSESPSLWTTVQWCRNHWLQVMIGWAVLAALLAAASDWKVPKKLATPLQVGMAATMIFVFAVMPFGYGLVNFATLPAVCEDASAAETRTCLLTKKGSGAWRNPYPAGWVVCYDPGAVVQTTPPWVGHGGDVFREFVVKDNALEDFPSNGVVARYRAFPPGTDCAKIVL